MDESPVDESREVGKTIAAIFIVEAACTRRRKNFALHSRKNSESGARLERDFSSLSVV
jgi:hypothetical protein